MGKLNPYFDIDYNNWGRKIDGSGNPKIGWFSQ